MGQTQARPSVLSSTGRPSSNDRESEGHELLPLTKAMLQRTGANLPSLQPLPLWLQGGHRTEWGWRAVPVWDRAGGTRPALNRRSGSDGERESEPAVSTPRARASNYDRTSVAAVRTSERSARSLQSSCRESAESISSSEFQHEQNEKKKLDAWDLLEASYDSGWGPGNEDIEGLYNTGPGLPQPPRRDVIGSESFLKRERGSAALFTGTDVDALIEEENASQRRHRFSRSLKLAMDAQSNSVLGQEAAAATAVLQAPTTEKQQERPERRQFTGATGVHRLSLTKPRNNRRSRTNSITSQLKPRTHRISSITTLTSWLATTTRRGSLLQNTEKPRASLTQEERESSRVVQRWSSTRPENPVGIQSASPSRRLSKAFTDRISSRRLSAAEKAKKRRSDRWLDPVRV